MTDTAFRPAFADFAPAVSPRTPLRDAITAATRRSEPECIGALIDAATLPDADRATAKATATKLITALRAKHKGTGVEGLVQEYALSSREGVALMCLAEALLRIPDDDTRDALIRDKIADGDWGAHLGGGRSLFVNAATWGLIVTGKLVSSVDDKGLSAALTRLIARAGEPVIRRGVDMAMRLMGDQFVTGETIDKALVRSRAAEARGFGYSYDMLGEAAMTGADADRYYDEYEKAVHAIGKASAGRGIYGGPGISIKLSALHPRYSRAQAARVMGEMLPKVRELALLAKGYDIGLNIDAEEADRLELSLDLLEALALDPGLAGWNGLGFVVQAYGKRCPFVIDWIVDLAQRADRRIMVRLVKGAYWDAEIKRAQVDGVSDFPVYTRKVHTDVAYVACARRLLAARKHVFPQFATHNAQTLATIYQLAGPNFATGDYEFQCLHGMGEPLYDEVVGCEGLNRPCRIYAPVGEHETLLAYLVRRLLENGANSSFVNRIADPDVPVAELVADPVDVVRAMPVPGAPHPQIVLPGNLYPDRRNSAGLDLASEAVLAPLGAALSQSLSAKWTAGPAKGTARDVLNPGDHRDVVGTVTEISADDAQALVMAAASAHPAWAAVSRDERAAFLERAADLMETRIDTLLAIVMREAGKTAANAVAEVREAVDFLRYYALQARKALDADARPLGPVVCISPWNFPLAIFTGQVAAALVAGNTVVAKPAEETPLIAAQAISILHEAGIPEAALHLATGDGAVGAALVAASETAGVMFTGSTEVARLIQAELAKRLSPDGNPIPLIAETGGQNAMIVDSSALAEQVVGDVINSAFDSAGQRCSALRILCLQDDIADRTLAMLKGALRELSVGRTDRLDTDVGPVITAEAQGVIDKHIAQMKERGRTVEQIVLRGDASHGTFVPPTIIEIDSIADLTREVFGPVLHVLRYKREQLPQVIDAINASGYGLTFGLHTRLDETVAQVTAKVQAGNLYINRNMVGAVVGVQPFGGRGLSGTGPKAGGPLYIGRLVTSGFASSLQSGDHLTLDGPVGERNVYALHPRGTILAVPATPEGLAAQVSVILETGNTALVVAAPGLRDGGPQSDKVRWIDRIGEANGIAGALVEGDAAQIGNVQRDIASLGGPIVITQANRYRREWLAEEVSVSTNTTAAGGNAALMMLDGG